MASVIEREHATLVDTHCHLARLADPLAELESAAAANVVTIAVTELPSEFRRLRLRVGRRRLVRVAIGFHPLRVAAAPKVELDIFARHLDETDYVGEIGLDLSREGKLSAKRQIDVFESILSLAAIRRKILTVHSRGAERATIDRLIQARTCAILHWYSGPLREVDRALAAGFYFSVNRRMLRSERGRRILAALPADRVLTETDAPYAGVERRAARPADVVALTSELALYWGEPTENVAARVYENLARAYSAVHDIPAERRRATSGGSEVTARDGF